MKKTQIRAVLVALSVVILSLSSIVPIAKSQVNADSAKTPAEFVQVGFEIFKSGSIDSDFERMAQSFPWLSGAYEQAYFSDVRLFSALGLLYREGLGTSVNYEKAAEVFSKGVMRGSNQDTIFLICLPPYQSSTETAEALQYGMLYLEENPYLDEAFFEKWIGIFSGGFSNNPKNLECALELARISHIKGYLSGSLYFSSANLENYALAVQTGRPFSIDVNAHIRNLERVYLGGNEEIRGIAAFQISWANYLGLITGEPNLKLGREWMGLAASAGSVDARGILQVLSENGLQGEPIQCQYSCDFVKGFSTLRSEIIRYVAELEEAKEIEAEYQRQAAAQRQYYLQQNQQRIQASKQNRRSFWRSVGNLLVVAAEVYVVAKYGPNNNTYTPSQPALPQPAQRSRVTQNQMNVKNPSPAIIQSQNVSTGTCRVQTDCQPGLFCIKALSSDRLGVCGILTDSVGVRTFDEYDSYPSVTGQQCQFNVDCPAGYSCSKTGPISGICSR